MSRSRTDRAPGRRVLAVCALTGAALLTALTGGQAWADGAPAPATPTAAPSAAPAIPTATPTAGPAASGAVVVPKGSAPAQPAPARPTAGAPAAAGVAKTPTATPAPADAQDTNRPQVREVPKGAAQAGDGSTATDGNGLTLAAGGAVAAVGAGALGFALLRRRSGARG